MPEPRRWPPAKVLRELGTASGLPDGGSVERDRAMTHLVYRDGGLIRRLSVHPASPGALKWQVDVGDEQVRSPTTAMWTHYRPAPGLTFTPGDSPRPNFDGYPWPVSGGVLDDRLVRDVTRFAAAMLWFLADRRELGTMLLHDARGGSPITRGDVVGSRWGELAAGVVQAVILARAIPDPELEASALAKISEGEVAMDSIRHWAGSYREWSPVDVSDLADGSPWS